MADPNVEFCQSRRRKQLYNRPLARVETVSPYYNPITGAPSVDTKNAPITRFRIDMRRKVEILKYSSNRMPAQTNSLTKKEVWSRLANASGKSARLLDPETVICPGQIGVRAPRPMSSSASGVPGPVINLYEDPEVPLYNFIITRSYAYNVPNENSFWTTTINTNVGIGPNTMSTIFAVNINANINRSSARFSLDIPIGLTLKGTYTPTQNPPPIAETIDVSVSSAILNVLYNGIPTTSKTIASPNKYLNCQITPSGTNSITFDCTRYVGVISFTDIDLLLSSAYVFEFVLSLGLTVHSSANLASFNVVDTYQSSTQNVDTLQYYAYANMTNIISQPTKNIVVLGTSLGTTLGTSLGTTIPVEPPAPVLFGV